MSRLYFKKNSANAICDVCGFKYKLDQLQKRWDGLWVCQDDYEERHPQDFIRSRMDINKLPVTKPRGPAQFVDVCSVAGRTAYVGFATVGCAVVGNNYPSAEYLIETIDPMAHQGAVVGYAIVGISRVGVDRIFVWDDDGL